MAKIKQKYDEYGNVIETTTNDLIGAENAAYEQLRQQNEQLERQRQADAQANIKTFTDYINQGYNADQAMLMAARQDTDNAQVEAKQQVDADNRAARWTGLTELAASIANLVGVGAGKATSQQYRQYSQDWMQKADNDMRYHRARIDNLRERQRSIQQRQQQLKLQNNLTLAQMQAAARKESTDAQQRLAEQQAAHARNIAGLQYKGTQAAAEAAIQGAEKQAHLDIQQSNAAQGWERIRMAKDQNTLAMIQQGYVPDAKAPGGFRYDPDEAKAKYNIDVSAAGGGSKGKSEDALPIIDANGNVMVATIRPHERENLYATAMKVIPGDLDKEELKEFNSQLRKAKDEKEAQAVLLAWMGRSAKMGDVIRSFDSSYRGVHGRQKEPARPQEQPLQTTKKEEKKGVSTQDLINGL